LTASEAERSEGIVPLVIGIGNEVRGDDAAGLHVTRKLRSSVRDNVRIVESSGGVTELLDLWDGQDLVFVVDAIRSGGRPGSWLRIPVGPQPLSASLAGSSTHGLSLASAVALGQVLGKMPKRLVVYGIEVFRFDAGSGMSPEVVTGVAGLTAALAEELQRPRADLDVTGGQ
jgi:hydrogenase maturation protease